MMNFVLIVLLILLLMYAYFARGRDYVTASFFMIASFLLSSIFAFISIDDWGISNGFLSTFLIITALIVFSIGDIIGSRYTFSFKFRNRRITDDEYQTEPVYYIMIKPMIVMLVIIFMIITYYYYFIYIYNLSLRMGNKRGFAGMFQYARYALVNSNIDSSTSFILGHAELLSECLGYLFLFISIYNFILARKIISINLFPVFLYIFYAGISTARFNYLKFFSAGIIMFLLISIKNMRQLKQFRLKTLVLATGAIVFLLWGFRMLGYLTGKSSVRAMWADISTYVGSSIVAFDVYLKNPHNNGGIFGRETLYNIYKMARNVGLSDVPVYNVTLPFIRLGNGMTTNVYTALERLIQDYGYFFMHVIMFIEGIFYGSCMSSVKNNQTIGSSFLIFAYMFYPVLTSSIEEKFILNFTAISLLYRIIYFVVLFKLIIKKRIIVPQK